MTIKENKLNASIFLQGVIPNEKMDPEEKMASVTEERTTVGNGHEVLMGGDRYRELYRLAFPWWAFWRRKERRNYFKPSDRSIAILPEKK